MGRSRGLPRSSGAARGSAADGREFVRVCCDQPADAMTVIELVDRERARLRRMHVIAGLALAAGATLLLLAAGASLLGASRWMSLPKPLPFMIWLVVLAANVAVVLWTSRRLGRRAPRLAAAAAIEREPAMRNGAIRAALEVAHTGALGRRAAAAVTERLAPAGPRLAPNERRMVARGAVQATGAATVAAAMLAFAVPTYNDGFRAMLQPVSAWRGTLLPRVAFDTLPPNVLRGETLRLRVAAPQRTSVTVSLRVPGEAWSTQTLLVDRRTGIATTEIGPLRGDLTVVASDGRSETDTSIVRVTDRPFVGA